MLKSKKVSARKDFAILSDVHAKKMLSDFVMSFTPMWLRLSFHILVKFPIVPTEKLLFSISKVS